MALDKPSLELDYETPNVPVDLYNFEESLKCEDLGIDTYGSDKLAHVIWHFDPDARNFGIKSMGMIVDRVIATIEWQVASDDLTQEDIDRLVDIGGVLQRNGDVEGSVEIDSDQECNGRKWTINSNDFFMKQDGQCYPDDCEIDFKTMVISVS